MHLKVWVPFVAYHKVGGEKSTHTAFFLQKKSGSGPVSLEKRSEEKNGCNDCSRQGKEERHQSREKQTEKEGQRRVGTMADAQVR